MIPDHECHSFAIGYYYMRRRYKRKMDWKKFKRESKYEIVWKKTCSLCGKVLEDGPVPDLAGWITDWIYV